MRILDVSPKQMNGLDTGGTVRIYNLMRHLSEHHEVRQFSLAWDEPPPVRTSVVVSQHTSTYREYCYANPLSWCFAETGKRAWVGVPAASGVALSIVRPRLLDSLIRWADVIVVEFPYQFEYCRRRHGNRGLVLAAHNVERMKFPSWARAVGAHPSKSPWVRGVSRAERRAVTHADLILTVSEADRDTFMAVDGVEPARVVTVPNGADTDTYAPVDATKRREAKLRLGLPDATTVIFAGYDVPPNRVGLRWVIQVAAELPDITFLVVGSVGGTDQRTQQGNVIRTGFVKDFRTHLQAADLAICPIEHGAGTKIKLLEFLAAGLPTVAFAESLHGTDARDGVHAIEAEKSVIALSSALRRLASDGELAAAIGHQGRELVAERYAWRHSARLMNEALSDLAGKTGDREHSGASSRGRWL